MSSQAIYAIGDSITTAAHDLTDFSGYPTHLIDLLEAQTGSRWIETPTRYAVSGYTVADIRAGIDAQLAAASTTPSHVLMYLGANEVVSMPVEATYKTNMNYVIAAIHTKWSNAHIYVGAGSRPGDETMDTNAATIETWNADCIAGKSYCHVGIHYLDIFPGNEAALIGPDGVHPNHAGHVAMAAAWKTAIGY